MVMRYAKQPQKTMKDWKFIMTGGRFSMEILKVSSHSSPNSVAGAIAGVIREKKM